MPRLSSVSLLWKILFSTSIAITALFAITGWIVQRQVGRIASLSVEEEVRASFQSYESLWRARAEQLAGTSLVLSRMPDVRAAFGTGDPLTIRDTAGEIWDKISKRGGILLVSDPHGAVLASLGSPPDVKIQELPVVRAAANRFPNQAMGFLLNSDRLYQIVITPVYVAAGQGSALLNVLVAGVEVDAQLARELEQSTGGSQFVFRSQGRVVASTLDPASTAQLSAGAGRSGVVEQIRLGDAEYSQFTTPLVDLEGKSIGDLRILRSFESARRRIASLRANIVLAWLGAIILGLGLTYLLARRILKPVKALDQAASEISKGAYEGEVPVEGDDELGRLARSFNDMRSSIRSAREELIRQERIATIGRLSTSIIHDLRNPLAAIYGGAEMLVDDELSPQQVKRLASNIYRSSRRVQELLQELADVTRGRASGTELCRLREIVEAAYEALAPSAQKQGVSVEIDIADDLEVLIDRSPMERVFENLISNAIEAMPGGGAIRIRAERDGAGVVVTVTDTGPGIPPAIAGRLFEPFVTAGKKNGIGLGLALSRQRVLDHGGDLWAEAKPATGAKFFVRLPM